MGTNIRGIHHLTTITSDSPKIWDFFTNKLGLHLIKKRLIKTMFVRIIFIFLMTKARVALF